MEKFNTETATLSSFGMTGHGLLGTAVRPRGAVAVVDAAGAAAIAGAKADFWGDHAWRPLTS